MIAEFRPFVRPSSCTGTVSRSIAMPFGISTAPAIAWPVRSSTSNGKVGANVAANENPRNASRPARNTRDRPSWSLNRPPIGCATAMAMR